MIRQGRQQGWLKLPLDTLSTWSTLNGVQYNGVDVTIIPGKEERGSALRAIETLEQERNPLIIVPKDLIISKENVLLHAKSDRHLREVLEVAGEFSQTPRGAILIFMLVQATHSCPDIPENIGTSCAFSQYIKYLPYVELPTFWQDEDIELLQGTSLAPALTTKTKSLYREFEYLRDSTSSLEWCRKYWWDEIDGILDFDDWKQVDAMYRSRALEFPGIGDCMVPCVDMANHASGDSTSALYEADEDGNGLLLLREGQKPVKDDEITITYGDEKGACEMIFSYGFLEEDVKNARDILLGLDIPDDDPLKPAKKAISTSAPGVRLVDSTKGGLHWKSDYIWLICVNEEDGLDFRIAQTVDGGRELQALFRDKPLNDTSTLQSLLEESDMWEVYHLRAVSIIQDRVGEQLQTLMDTESSAQIDDAHDRGFPRQLALRLRKLETDMLERFYDFLENEKIRLCSTPVVKAYLESAAGNDEEDFS